MSDRTKFEKVDGKNPSRKDMYRSRDDKYFPKEASQGEGGAENWTKSNPLNANHEKNTQGNINGDYDHNFNNKAKVTKNSGSDYHDYQRPNSGLHGNFAEKDASLAYLRDRNKQGIEVNHFSGTSKQARLTVGHGPTAFDTRPIPETYKAATSQGAVDPNAVVYNTSNKSRNIPQSPGYVQDTNSNQIKKPIAKHIKSKE